MSVANPGFRIPRQSVAGMENEWVKMWDPPTPEDPNPAVDLVVPTPELLTPTNPVPDFIAANVPGAVVTIPNTVRRDLMHGTDIPMWDGRSLRFFTFGDPDIPAASGGVWPGPTIRVPRGVIFHGETHGKGPPPHTIHWHGIEPTPMNDGVGHCSMELGTYTYQWQPNFIGTYFYHCHRNTVQHFEYGLYGMLLVEPPDAYDPSVPIDAGGPPKNVGGYPRRTAANLVTPSDDFRQKFPGFVGGDPTHGVGTATGVGDPRAFTVPYDVEALWVLDDVDSAWRILAPDARATFPEHGTIPGVNDNFRANNNGFFAFNDFNPDYFFASGVPFRGRVGDPAPALLAGPGQVGYPLGAGTTIPPDLNSGVSGMQVAINAQRNQTILIRALCAAYVTVKVTFPVDVVIIAFDGRALGVPPFGLYNRAFRLPKDTPYELSTARRFDVLMRETSPMTGQAKVEFRHNRDDRLLLNGRIPITIT